MGLWVAEHGGRESGSGRTGGPGRHEGHWDWGNSCWQGLDSGYSFKEEPVGFGRGLDMVYKKEGDGFGLID